MNHIPATSGLNRLVAGRGHAKKETGREGASNTDPALTETAYLKEASNGC